MENNFYLVKKKRRSDYNKIGKIFWTPEYEATDGCLYSVKELAEKFNVHNTTITYRMRKYGWDSEILFHFKNRGSDEFAKLGTKERL